MLPPACYRTLWSVVKAGMLLWALAATSVLADPPPNAGDDWVLLSRPTSPEVSYVLARDGKTLNLSIRAANFAGASSPVNLQAGLAADKEVTLTNKDAKVTQGKESSVFQFSIPADRLITNESGWKKLRFALAVEWGGGPLGQPRLRENFLQLDHRAIHSPLSENKADWTPIDLAELEREARDRALQIHFPFNQPLEGKATIVINDGDGKRVRNLISAQQMSVGEHRIVWDGLDDAGNPVPPATYQWKAISHPGLTPNYLFSFVDAPGSNHGTMQSAAFNGTSLFFAAPLAEGGHELVELALDGTLKRGINLPHGHGLGIVAIIAEGKYLYIAHDGISWTEKIDRTKSDWKTSNRVTLARLDLETGTLAEFPGKVRYADLKKYPVGPGSEKQRSEKDYALTGFAFYQGKIYAGDREANQLLVIDPLTGKVEKTLPLADPVALASGSAGLFAIAGGQLQKVDPVSGALSPITKLTGQPVNFTIGPDGRFYISDRGEQVVQVLDPKGKRVATVGTPGGIAPGKYDPQKMQNPNGLVVANDLLWVTETERWEPKRLSAYDLASGQMVKEFFGPTNYGAQGAGFDDQDHNQWLGQGTVFDVDFTTGKATPKSITGGETGRRHTFWRQDGRTFIITSGKATYVQELLPDGTLKPLALISSAHQYAYSKDWNPPAAFVEAFQKAYPEAKIQLGVKGGIQRIQPGAGYGMLWVDRDGDGKMQTEEIEFATAATNLAGSGWSHDFHDLTLRLPAEIAGQKVMVTLKPEGWWPGGAPRYPALNDAVTKGVPIDLPGSPSAETAVDRFGDVIVNSNPEMRAFNPEGRLLWTYPNKWVGVHGSHNAPLPLPGQLQGVLFFSGVVPLDDKSDVMLLNGNHGQAFLLTSDGLYLDAMFPDVRLMNDPQGGGIGVLGGECFGGTFGRSEKDGNYYFQGGGISYRVYRVDGLKQTVRSEGSVVVTAEQATAAERNRTRQEAEKTQPKVAVIEPLTVPITLDGKDGDWKSAPTVKWDKDGKFPVTVRARQDGKMLYLQYSVKDDSPWVNNGKDWQSLFKTGDGIDLQLGTDPEANPKRSSAVPGDLRLFIAPMGAENVAVLYRHRVPGAAATDSVDFQSPWRTEKVDVVRKLDTAQIAVQKQRDGYSVEAAIPLADLGLKVSEGKPLRGDFGVIYGDGEGTVNIFRNYWSNQATGLVNDVPGEIMLNPNLWGEITFSESTPPTPAK